MWILLLFVWLVMGYVLQCGTILCTAHIDFQFGSVSWGKRGRGWDNRERERAVESKEEFEYTGGFATNTITMAFHF